MNSNTCVIASCLQASIVGIYRHLHRLWHRSWLYAAGGKAYREPASTARTGLPLQGQCSLVADSKHIRYLLPPCKLPKIKIWRIDIQLCLPGRDRRADVQKHGNLYITAI